MRFPSQSRPLAFPPLHLFKPRFRVSCHYLLDGTSDNDCQSMPEPLNLHPAIYVKNLSAHSQATLSPKSIQARRQPKSLALRHGHRLPSPNLGNPAGPPTCSGAARWAHCTHLQTLGARQIPSFIGGLRGPKRPRKNEDPTNHLLRYRYRDIDIDCRL